MGRCGGSRLTARKHLPVHVVDIVEDPVVAQSQVPYGRHGQSILTSARRSLRESDHAPVEARPLFRPDIITRRTRELAVPEPVL